MLKASGKEDATRPQTEGKAPVMISDLAKLFLFLTGKGPEAEAVKDLAIIAFWEMARMAKLTYKSSIGEIPFKKGITLRDVQTYTNVTTLNIHKAKTAKPGKIQKLKLRPMSSPLCPVKALNRRLALVSSRTDSLFGFSTPSEQINLTKRRANKTLGRAWQAIGQPHLTGHSFWVRGALLHHAAGVNVEEIKSLAQWTSNCYKVYIRQLAPEDVTCQPL
jgi:hypothetical protein